MRFKIIGLTVLNMMLILGYLACGKRSSDEEISPPTGALPATLENWSGENDFEASDWKLLDE